MTIVRDATLDDIPAMVALGREMHTESPIYRDFDFDGDRVAEYIEYLLGWESGIVLAAERRGQIIGGFLGHVTRHWFGHDLAAGDIILFIAPEHRGGMAAVRMIQGYFDRAAARGCKQVTLSQSTGVGVDRLAALFAVLGFSHVGQVYSRTV